MKIEDCFKCEYPLNFTVKIKDKEQFIVFNNLCNLMHIHINYDVDVIEDNSKCIVQEKKKELSINDILAEFNEGKNK